MPASSFFRLCIVVSLVLGIVGAFIDAVPGLVPEELWQAYETAVPGGIDAKDIALMVVGVPLIVVAIASTVGLYRFRPWARRVALYVTVAGLLTYPLTDVQIVSPWSQLLTEVSFLAWGVVLAMAFLPPLEARFRRSRADSSSRSPGAERPAAD